MRSSRTSSYSAPPEAVGKTIHVRADDETVRVLLDGAEVARHARTWDRRRHVEDPRHVAKLLERRKGALGPRRKDRIAAPSDACRVYLQEVARRRIDLENEVVAAFSHARASAGARFDTDSGRRSRRRGAAHAVSWPD